MLNKKIKFFNKFWLLIISIFILSHYSFTMETEKQVSPEISIISPDRVEFAWDVHDVLVKPNITKMCYIALTRAGFKVTKMSLALSYEYFKYCYNGHVGPTHKLVKDILALLKRNIGSTSEEYKPILDTYDPALWRIAEQMATEHYAINGMLQIIQKLNNLGYTQRVATNMGLNDFDNLVKRHPDFLSCIKNGSTVDFKKCPDIRKPHKSYFERHNRYYNPDNLKTIIFIDDRKENVDAAIECGMIGILFENSQQLRSELKKMGIFL